MSLIDPATEDASLKTYRGQALAARAYDYLNLVQIYQFTYAGHENALAVPIVTEKMSDEEMQNNPRATVQQVYDQIMSDLNQAAELLAGFDNGANKDQLDEAVVYGLRARANLLMQKWLMLQKMQKELLPAELRNHWQKYLLRHLIQLLQILGYGVS